MTPPLTDDALVEIAEAVNGSLALDLHAIRPIMRNLLDTISEAKATILTLLDRISEADAKCAVLVEALRTAGKALEEGARATNNVHRLASQALSYADSAVYATLTNFNAGEKS